MWPSDGGVSTNESDDCEKWWDTNYRREAQCVSEKTWKTKKVRNSVDRWKKKKM